MLPPNCWLGPLGSRRAQTTLHSTLRCRSNHNACQACAQGRHPTLGSGGQQGRPSRAPTPRCAAGDHHQQQQHTRDRYVMLALMAMVAILLLCGAFCVASAGLDLHDRGSALHPGGVYKVFVGVAGLMALLAMSATVCSG